MKWNEAVAIAVAVVMGVIFLIVPLGSLILDVGGIIDEDPKYSAYDGDYWDIDDFIEDVEDYNAHVPGSIYYNGKGNNDGTYDYQVKSIVSTPTLLLGDLIDPKTTVYVAVGVERSYTQEEIRALRSFLAKGGHAVIADDFGNANQIAKDFGVTYFGGQFFDERFESFCFMSQLIIS